jgi:predicted AAA+ superfamily ATPase
VPLLAHRGAIAEQFLAQELMSYTLPNQSPQLYYWHREEKSSQAKIDFLTEYQSEILPIEVKSDKGGRLKSLHLFLKEKEEFVRQALKVSMQNYSKEGKILTLPFYALMKWRYQLLSF